MEQVSEVLFIFEKKQFEKELREDLNLKNLGFGLSWLGKRQRFVRMFSILCSIPLVNFKQWVFL